MMLYTKLRLKAGIEKFLGIQIKLKSRHGHSDCNDIQKSGCNISTIFDVGANVGQSALKYRVAFPSARIICFEPVKSTFEQLKANVAFDKNVSCHNVAFGSENGQATIYLNRKSTTNSLVKPVGDPGVGSEVVEIKTVDGFALSNQIDRIDLLKIDVEGHDLEVLKGAQKMLQGARIPFVLVECGFQPSSTKQSGDTAHVLFEDIGAFLRPFGYSLFGIYDQNLEWSGEQRIRFANACFSNESAFASKR